MLLRTYLVCFSVFTLLNSPVGWANAWYRVIDEPVNVRVGPGVTHGRIDSVYKDQQVRQLTRQGRWAQVMIVPLQGDALTGWIHTDFLVPVEHSGAGSVEPSQPLVANVIGQHIQCLHAAGQNTLSHCLVTLDLTASGPLNHQAIRIDCRVALAMYGPSTEQISEKKGYIRTPLKHGKGAARMQLIVLPDPDLLIKQVIINGTQCHGHAPH